jgi:hypothetical protein
MTGGVGYPVPGFAKTSTSARAAQGQVPTGKPGTYVGFFYLQAEAGSTKDC